LQPLLLLQIARVVVCSGGFPFGRDAFQHAKDVTLLHDQELFVIDLDFGTRPFAEQHSVASLYVERLNHALLVTSTRSDGDNFALLRLFLGSVRNDAAALARLLNQPFGTFKR
jgi:hypothetical protein